MATRLTSKGQVTIPKAIRDHLGVAAGDGVDFHVVNGRVEVCREGEHNGRQRRLAEAIADIRRRRPVRDGIATDAYMAMIRDEP